MEGIREKGERREGKSTGWGEAEEEIVGQVELEGQARQERMGGPGGTDRLRDAVAGERLQIGIAFRPELADFPPAAKQHSRRGVIATRLARAAHPTATVHSQLRGGGSPRTTRPAHPAYTTAAAGIPKTRSQCVMGNRGPPS